MKITDLPSITYYSGDIQNFADQLGPSGIQNILCMIHEAYLNLKQSNKIQPDMNEVQITEEFYVEINSIWKDKGDSSIVPLTEKPDMWTKSVRGKPPSIDFCFRDKWNPELYFGSECKKLEENNTRRFKDYIDGGVKRYLLGTYGHSCSCGSMIGYLINVKPTKIVKEVISRVDETADVSKSLKSNIIKNFSLHYISGHTRKNGISPFYIHHLFLVFNAN